MAELGTRCTHRKGAGRKLSAYGCARRISTRRAGHVSPGVTRELGRATYLLVQHPEWGTGRPKALACAGGFAPHTSPVGTPRTDGSTQGTGTRVTNEAARDGQGAVLVEHSTAEGGEVRPKRPTGGKATPGITRS